MAFPTSDPVERVYKAWGANPPDWVLGLARACEWTSQNRVAQAMQCSPSKINQILGNKYAADLRLTEERYRGVFEAKTVPCPALGALPAQQCLDWRQKAKALVPTNTRRVMMFRACNACPIHCEEET